MKCNPQLYVDPPADRPVPPQPARPTDQLPPSATMISCGTGFFSTDTAARLAAQFGTISCFRFSDSSQWIAVGDGMSVTSQATPPDASPGGSIVALAVCADGDRACLDPDHERDFSNFTVFYAPVPRSGRAHLQTTFGSRLLYVSLANCGIFLFDTKAGRWHVGSKAIAADVLADKSAPTLASAPPANGRSAMDQPPPSASREGCS